MVPFNSGNKSSDQLDSKIWISSQFLHELVLSVLSFLLLFLQSEIQLRQEVVMKQKLEGVLNEHRELIDALTAEILLVREESIATQVLRVIDSFLSWQLMELREKLLCQKFLSIIGCSHVDLWT